MVDVTLRAIPHAQIQAAEKKANGGFYVADIHGPDSIANAQLIAAAPALLDLLKHIRRDASAYQWHAVVDAAIARAEGR
jgi:hypothetical protein